MRLYQKMDELMATTCVKYIDYARIFSSHSLFARGCV